MVRKERKTTVKQLQCWSRYEMVAFDFCQGSQLEWSRSANTHVIEIALLVRYGNRKLINCYIFNSAFSKVYKLQTSLKAFVSNEGLETGRPGYKLQAGPLGQLTKDPPTNTCHLWVKTGFLTSNKASFVRSFFYIVTIGVVRLTMCFTNWSMSHTFFARMYILITTKKKNFKKLLWVCL